MRLRHLQVSPERDEPGDDDNHNDDDLDDPQDVQQAQPPAQLRTMQDERERQARPADQARLPVVLARVRDVPRREQVVPEDDRVAGRPAEQDAVRGVEGGDEVLTRRRRWPESFETRTGRGTECERLGREWLREDEWRLVVYATVWCWGLLREEL